jgi:hypothetical protein
MDFLNSWAFMGGMACGMTLVVVFSLIAIVTGIVMLVRRK